MTSGEAPLGISRTGSIRLGRGKGSEEKGYSLDCVIGGEKKAP